MWIILVIVISGIIYGIARLADRRAGKDWFFGPLIVFGIFFTVIFSVLFIVSIEDAIELEVFYDTNASVYEATSAALYEGIEGSGEGELLDAPNLMQVQGYADVLKAQRDTVVEYNKDLKIHRFWQDNWASGFMYRNVPDRLEYLSLD